MSRHISHLHTASALLQSYSGDRPFSGFLKPFFSSHKKYGSSDRKQIAHLCYSAFRVGKAMTSLPVEERILTGLFLTAEQSHPLLELKRPEWIPYVSTSLAKKLAILSGRFSMADIFPWKEELSASIEGEAFTRSFLQQPRLFIRTRPGYEQMVPEKLKTAGLPFEQMADTILSLANSTKIESILELDKEAVIQDLNSQKVLDALLRHRYLLADKDLCSWDCCAASGGKTLLLFDKLGKTRHWVSDIRASVLKNLTKRLATAGIQGYTSLEIDLSAKEAALPSEKFDLIIADVPCTGSGTWARTPEQLYFFEEKETGRFQHLQRKIIQQVIRCLKPGGLFLYVTCSVFQKENEDNGAFILENRGMKLLEMETLAGYSEKADSMFCALFTAG